MEAASPDDVLLYSSAITSVQQIRLSSLNYRLHSSQNMSVFDTGPVLCSDQRADSYAVRGRSLPVWHPAAKHLPSCAASVPLLVAVQRPPQSQPVRQRQGLRQPAGHLDWKGEFCFTGLRVHRYDVKYNNNLPLYKTGVDLCKACITLGKSCINAFIASEKSACYLINCSQECRSVAKMHCG